jgi:hypothetical protein
LVKNAADRTSDTDSSPLSAYAGFLLRLFIGNHN